MPDRHYYLFEIESTEKPIFAVGEWESIENLTQDLTHHSEVLAYGEINNEKYIPLYQK
ncbi:hypothetical protein [Halalkalibacter hemicellulosilyticus]|uniref:Uncharacterized protein n=1 Tax=Halalkalibacter hemicellulosilyticusJCM 9152 TaxID=1236971 RepID=W4QL77_9BACI|nr:hypothetical protein [Halalkalibacter hemicellulosilyticus]GAE32841.1 hypothetical protein JCM9152_4426 [Halalkalibacter hemicellulosilyticusJCM 9152]